MNRFNSVSSYRDSFVANPVFLGKKQPKPAKKRNAPANRGAIKQYGDEGYVPSNGRGVGY